MDTFWGVRHLLPKFEGTRRGWPERIGAAVKFWCLTQVKDALQEAKKSTEGTNKGVNKGLEAFRKLCRPLITVRPLCANEESRWAPSGPDYGWKSGPLSGCRLVNILGRLRMGCRRTGFLRPSAMLIVKLVGHSVAFTSQVTNNVSRYFVIDIPLTFIYFIQYYMLEINLFVSFKRHRDIVNSHFMQVNKPPRSCMLPYKHLF